MSTLLLLLFLLITVGQLPKFWPYLTDCPFTAECTRVYHMYAERCTICVIIIITPPCSGCEMTPLSSDYTIKDQGQIPQSLL